MSYRTAFRQYIEIIRFVEQNEYPSKEEIQLYLEDVGITVSNRTIERYMQGLRDEFDIDIDYDTYHKGYYIKEYDAYVNRFLRLVQTKLNSDIMLETLKDVKGNLEYMSFEYGESLQGMHQMKDILFAIKSQKKVAFQHYNFWSDKTYDIALDSYMVREYAGRWYLIGYNDFIEDYRTYAIDRISNLNVSSEGFEKRKDNPVRKFDHVIGVVYGDEKPVSVKLLFDEFQGKYIENLPLHDSQKTTQTPKGLLVELYIIPNIEFEQKILMHGELVKVLEPQSLKESIMQRHQNAAKLYIS